eukprot:CAMPEP_0194334830 /NCGR_PEP_ID=MMETSP0171-20130528/67448_1 /TAXON_ID=218684 /ORGANISM="Corethron pennatum, Strain L29A3" /LENGTH=65 /DNA_ID=CAMNT_0039097649 /DNA_START=234 /DNA_END=431 /DNA_ORIENTATION=+
MDVLANLSTATASNSAIVAILTNTTARHVFVSWLSLEAQAKLISSLMNNTELLKNFYDGSGGRST